MKHARRTKILALATLGVALLTGLVDRPVGAGFRPPGSLIESKRFGQYELRVYSRYERSLFERICAGLPNGLSELAYHTRFRCGWPAAWSGVEIRRNGRRVWGEYGFRLQVAEFGSNQIVGMSVTGDGVPNIALADELGRQGGGSLCLFACGKTFEKIATVKSLGFYPRFEDLNHDGVPELMVSDDAFYHWPICRDGEPMPEVILRWRNGRYVAAKDLMHKPAPPVAELESRAAQIRVSPLWEEFSYWPPDTVAEISVIALKLLYSGHEDLAWRFIDAAWKPSADGKEQFIIDLRSRLQESLYWGDLK